MSSLQAFALGLGTALATLAAVQIVAYPVGRTLQAALRPRIKVTPLDVRATCVEYRRKSQVRWGGEGEDGAALLLLLLLLLNACLACL